MKTKIVCTLLVFGILYLTQALLTTMDPLVSGKASVLQLNPNDVDYLKAHTGMHLVPWVKWLLSLLGIFILYTIWKSNLKSMYQSIKEELNGPPPGTAACIAVVALLLTPLTAKAYYSKANYTEMMVILPNQTAFMVPVVGDNASGQAKFGSADYYVSKKVATKRVEIPHTQLQGSSWYANYWVPSANLILVNRIAYFREWTADPTTGTSKKNEAIRCESADSIGVTVAVAISAEIEEEDAAAYLYRFGVITPFDTNSHLQPDQMSDNQGAQLFASVFYAKDLDTIMDTVVHGAVKTAMCNEMARWKLEDLFLNKAAMIDNVNKVVAAMYKPDGITMRYIGYASDLQYSSKIQDSIDDVFIARRHNDATVALGSAIPVMHEQANIEIKKSIAKTIGEKGLPPVTLPSFLWLPSNIFDTIAGWFGKTPEPQVMNVPTKKSGG